MCFLIWSIFLKVDIYCIWSFKPWLFKTLYTPNNRWKKKLRKCLVFERLNSAKENISHFPSIKNYSVYSLFWIFEKNQFIRKLMFLISIIAHNISQINQIICKFTNFQIHFGIIQVNMFVYTYLYGIYSLVTYLKWQEMKW